jgi:hypothetical protein
MIKLIIIIFFGGGETQAPRPGLAPPLDKDLSVWIFISLNSKDIIVFSHFHKIWKDNYTLIFILIK